MLFATLGRFLQSNVGFFNSDPKVEWNSLSKSYSPLPPPPFIFSGQYMPIPTGFAISIFQRARFLNQCDKRGTDYFFVTLGHFFRGIHVGAMTCIHKIQLDYKIRCFRPYRIRSGVSQIY